MNLGCTLIYAFLMGIYSMCVNVPRRFPFARQHEEKLKWVLCPQMGFYVQLYYDTYAVFLSITVHALICEASPDGWAVWGIVVSTHWWLLVDHCVLRNWDRILVRAVKGLISRAGMVSICPLLWQRDVKLQPTKPTYMWKWLHSVQIMTNYSYKFCFYHSMKADSTKLLSVSHNLPPQVGYKWKEWI